MEERERLAVHEAGRAVAACVLTTHFDQVSIVPEQESVKLKPVVDVSAQESYVLVGFAGPAAVALHTNHRDAAIEMLSQDYDRIVLNVERLLDTGTVSMPRDVLVVSLWERVLALLVGHWGAVTVLADMLRDFGHVGRNEVQEILAHTTNWQSRV